MECTTCYCPHPQCTHYGQRGFDAHLVRCGTDRGIPRLLCTMCKATFSVRQGAAYCGVRAEDPHDTIAMRVLAEGHSLRGTGRIVDVDKDTVCDWVDRAGRHCRVVTTYLFDTLPITAYQVAAGLRDHVWTMEELLSYRVPPDFRDRLAQQTVNNTLLPFYPRYRGTPPYFPSTRDTSRDSPDHARNAPLPGGAGDVAGSI